MKRRRPRRAQVHLPPLDAGYALTLVDIFERAIAAIWRAHGDHMAQLLEFRRSARAAPPKRADRAPRSPDDELF